MDYAEQISAFGQKRATLVAANSAIMEEAGKAGATLDADQKETYDGNTADIKEIDEHLKRLDDAQKAAIATAKPVDGSNATNGSDSRAGIIQVKAQPKLEPGMEFVRGLKVYYMADGIQSEALNIAKELYGENANVIGTIKAGSMRGGGKRFGINGIQKAEVPAGATVSGNWAEDLVGDTTSAFADFVAYLRPMTILGKFGANGIPPLRRIPFRTPLISQTAGGEGYWVGEGKAKPLTSFDFSRTTLEPLKVANICVLTDEVLRDSSPSAEAIVRDQLAEALKARLDIDFLDPAKTASAGVSPASITNAAPNGAASGTDAEAVRDDIRSLLNEYIAANNPPSTGVLIMRSGTALALSMMVNALGQSEFNGIGMNGGTLLGIPVITSEHVASGVVVMVNASDIYLADEGGIRIDMSREASIEMLDSSLTGDSIGVVPGTAASTVNMFQTNSVAFLAERTINWAARRASAVAYLSGVAWGGAVNDLS